MQNDDQNSCLFALLVWVLVVWWLARGGLYYLAYWLGL